MSKRIVLLFEVTFGLFLLVLPIVFQSSPVQNVVSGNMTLTSIAEVTRMPSWYIFVFLFVITLLLFTYLWIKTGEQKGDDIKSTVKEVQKDLRIIKAHLGIKEDDQRIKESGKQENGDDNSKSKA